MVAVGQFQAGHPGTIGHLAHGVGIGLPTVEVAYQGDTRGTGRAAEEIDVMPGAPGGVGVRRDGRGELRG